MTGVRIRATVAEARELWTALHAAGRDEPAGSVAVSGMLAQQLARELAAGADPGAVDAGDGAHPPASGIVVHVIAGEPSEDDLALVRASDRAGVPVVLVQLWPQADWASPFVLTPFVVECRPGQGFPVGEIAARIAEAAGNAAALASRVPVLRAAVSERVVRATTARAALLGAAGARRGASRTQITLEQVRMLSLLRSLTSHPPEAEATPVLAGAAAAVYASGFALREAARALRRALPAPVVDAAVAAAGTWALAKAAQTLEARALRR